MADYDFKYRMTDNTKDTSNGSGDIQHNIQIISRESGTSDEFLPVKNLERTIFIPGSDAITALASGTNPEKRAAYKQLISDNLTHTASTSMQMPVWNTTAFEAYRDANDISLQAYNAFESFRIDLGQSYPIDFDL
jgi:hypothetical protein